MRKVRNRLSLERIAAYGQLKALNLYGLVGMLNSLMSGFWSTRLHDVCTKFHHFFLVFSLLRRVYGHKVYGLWPGFSPQRSKGCAKFAEFFLQRMHEDTKFTVIRFAACGLFFLTVKEQKLREVRSRSSGRSRGFLYSGLSMCSAPKTQPRRVGSSGQCTAPKGRDQPRRVGSSGQCSVRAQQLSFLGAQRLKKAVFSKGSAPKGRDQLLSASVPQQLFTPTNGVKKKPPR